MYGDVWVVEFYWFWVNFYSTSEIHVFLNIFLFGVFNKKISNSPYDHIFLYFATEKSNYLMMKKQPGDI